MATTTQTSPTTPSSNFKTLHSLIDPQLRRAAAERSPATSNSRYKPQFAECPQHGQYPLNMLDEHGVERWFPSGCPVCRKQAEAARLLKASNIPPRFVDCTFSNYVVSLPQQQRVLDRCQAYATDFSKYHQTGGCLLMCGRPGTGKNHLATAIIREVLAAGYSVQRVKAAQYLDAYWSKDFAEREAWLQCLASIDLLMIDEIGRASNAKAAQDALFRLIDARYEAQRPSLLTTNLARDELIEVLGDAAYDRITQGGSIRLSFDWESYRKAPLKPSSSADMPLERA